MRLPLFIARRYLFSKKKQNAINIISIISIAGVAIGTTALIVIMSVFNGIDLFLQESSGGFNPDIVISPSKGKFATFDTTIYQTLRNTPEIASYDNIVEEKALVKYGEKLLPVIVKGVDSAFITNSEFENNIIQGNLVLKAGNTYKSLVGYGIAAELGIGLNFLTPLVFYYPNKESASVMTALNTEYLYPSAIFSSQQDIEGKYILTDIGFAQQLFRIENKISKIEIKLTDGGQLEQVKEKIQQSLGTAFKAEGKFELNKSFYAMMRSEKLVVFLVLLFILLIASFNIVGSISMLILDKKEDLGTYMALGMTQKNIISIFKTEGNLITIFGVFTGLFTGILICLLQEKFGFITLGDGSYIITAYPVKLVLSDILLTIITVLIIGYIASYFPVKYLVKKFTR